LLRRLPRNRPQSVYSRPGNDLTDRFPLIVEALAGLRPRACILNGRKCAPDPWLVELQTSSQPSIAAVAAPRDDSRGLIL